MAGHETALQTEQAHPVCLADRPDVSFRIRAIQAGKNTRMKDGATGRKPGPLRHMPSYSLVNPLQR
ncbi:uncharacterized protein SETTUDRAFT_169856 [Exserohilum turcica Et28A]|uniref:Uncharacterized protein n=1 Tax=Exserohilum turcicum (strain 28A) TaxID=671987 RepID=R0J0T7_EXST2|nr:uncharacterized protein SETTUDRAFT_169856 [Exserohilum turcica Et28A]EOA90570.1 hypothetical protein SETTUDRAFT_169856 [Exserohilum turcica Et28A]